METIGKGGQAKLVVANVTSFNRCKFTDKFYKNLTFLHKFSTVLEIKLSYVSGQKDSELFLTSGGSKMSSIRTAATLVILAVIITGISMANKPNVGDGINITVSPSTLMLSRDIPCVTIHSNIPDEVEEVDLWLYRSIDGVLISDPIQPYLTKTDAMGHLVAKFRGVDIRTIVAPGEVELTLIEDENLEDEIDPVFSASDTIRVKY
jgi:hypothetical protein